MTQDYPKQLELDNIYGRVERNGKWTNVCLSDMTKEEYKEFVSDLNYEGMHRTKEHLDGQLLELAAVIAGYKDPECEFGYQMAGNMEDFVWEEIQVLRNFALVMLEKGIIGKKGYEY